MRVLVGEHIPPVEETTIDVVTYPPKLEEKTFLDIWGKNSVVCLEIASCVVILLGGIVAGLFNKNFNDSLAQSATFHWNNEWKLADYESCANSTRSFYFFNITNLQDFRSGIESKAIVEQVGPYNFTQEGKIFCLTKPSILPSNISVCTFDFEQQGSTLLFRQYFKVQGWCLHLIMRRVGI